LASRSSNERLWLFAYVVGGFFALATPAYIVLNVLPPPDATQSEDSASASPEIDLLATGSTHPGDQRIADATPKIAEVPAVAAPRTSQSPRVAALAPSSPGSNFPLWMPPIPAAIPVPERVERPTAFAPPVNPKATIGELMAQKNMPKNAPILLRIFKQEAELEVWKRDKSGTFALLKTYPICRWSGQLGPKMKTGDLQSPEGFYSVTPAAMNPNSSYHLSFNLGFPNAYDRAHGRSGSFLMVHGACKSVGCYAMTDQQITEIYALANDAFSGGQAAFQVQAYPFRMTANNLARHRDSPHMAFWQNLKEGSDHFEVTNQPPQVAVCEKRYVFGTTTAGCQSPAGPQSLMARITAKRKADEKAVAALVSRGAANAPLINYTDGGMHPSFARVFARQ